MTRSFYPLRQALKGLPVLCLASLLVPGVLHAQEADGPVPVNAPSGQPAYGPSLDDAWTVGNEAIQAEDWSLAWSIFQPLAERGRAGAAWHVGNMLYSGKGVKRDREQAFFWYHKAAEQYLLPAMRQIAEMHHNGDGTSRNLERAAFWYFAAARAQDAQSAFELARYYEAGLGVAQNTAIAMGWYAKAAQAGYQPALDRLAAIVSRQQRLDTIPETARDDVLAKNAPALPEMPWPQKLASGETGQQIQPETSELPATVVPAPAPAPAQSGPAPDLFTNPDTAPEEANAPQIDERENKQSTGPAFSLFLDQDTNTTAPDN